MDRIDDEQIATRLLDDPDRIVAARPIAGPGQHRIVGRMLPIRFAIGNCQFLFPQRSGSKITNKPNDLTSLRCVESRFAMSWKLHFKKIHKVSIINDKRRERSYLRRDVQIFLVVFVKKFHLSEWSLFSHQS